MDVFSRGIQNAGIILMVCGCLLAVTITPLPYKDGQRRNDRLIQAKGERILETQPLNERQVHGTYQTKGSARVTIDEQPVSGVEPGFRTPKGSATFLDQEEGNRIRRQMMGERGSPGFWGGNENRRGYDDRRNYDNNYDGNRYLGNEIDRDPYYYEQKSRGDTVYYPNYNPEPSPSNRRDYECDPRSKSYHGYQGGRGGYDNNGNRGYNGRGGGYDEKGYGGYNGNRGRRYDDRTRNQPSSYDRNRGGDQWGGRGGNSGGNQWNDRNRGGDQWGGRGGNSGGNQWNDRNVYDRDDNIGEGTVGFYGKVRRP